MMMMMVTMMMMMMMMMMMTMMVYQWESSLRHLSQHSKGPISPRALLARTDGSATAHCIRQQQGPIHFQQQHESSLPLFAFLARTNGCTQCVSLYIKVELD